MNEEYPNYNAYLSKLREEFPQFRIRPKRGDRLSTWIDRALKLVTLGRQDRYLTEYHTVLGETLWVPDAWARLGDLERVVLLRHERIHLLQRRRWGSVGMALLYLLPLLPVGLAYGRARLEWEAYEETLRATAELLGREAARSPALRRQIVGRFTGPDYGWMWPFEGQVERWYSAALARVESSLGPADSHEQRTLDSGWS